MKIFVVIPSWNGAHYLKECLTSLKNQTTSHEVILVDNGSTDNTVATVKENFSDVLILSNEKNLGFAGGVNTGIKHALSQNADYVALFNNDAVAERGWLENLVKSIREDKNLGIVTSKIITADKSKLDSTGEFYSIYGIPFPRGRDEKILDKYDKKTDIFGASGGASLYSTKMLKEIGIFDERYFAYYEDVDVSFRAQLAGWKVSFEPRAIVYHEIGGTSSKMGDFTRYHSIKNFLILYTKNMPTKLYWKYLPFFIYQFLRTTVRSIIDFKLHIWLKSILVFLFYLPGVLLDRYKIQKNKKVETSYIDSILYKSKP